jgi:hypothetical protein
MLNMTGIKKIIRISLAVVTDKKVNNESLGT